MKIRSLRHTELVSLELQLTIRFHCGWVHVNLQASAQCATQIKDPDDEVDFVGSWTRDRKRHPTHEVHLRLGTEELRFQRAQSRFHLDVVLWAAVPPYLTI